MAVAWDTRSRCFTRAATTPSPWGGYAELHTLAVLPESRGSGIGTALLDAVDAALADRAIPNFTVTVMAQNAAVIRLYRRRRLIPGELIMDRIDSSSSIVPAVRAPSLPLHEDIWPHRFWPRRVLLV